MQIIQIFHMIIWRFPEIGGTPKSSIFMVFSIINRPFGGTPNLWKPSQSTIAHGTSWLRRFLQGVQEARREVLGGHRQMVQLG